MPINFLLPFIVDPGLPYALRNMRNGRVLAHNVIGAFDSRARRKGLLGRGAFADGQAMVIAPSNAIHTLGMKFPIDVAFVRRDGRILKCAPAIQPWRMAMALRAYAAIELPAGALTRHETKVGDVMTIVPAVSSVVDTSLTAQAG